MENPNIGRIVHVRWPDGVESPAIVTRTKGTTVAPVDRWGHTPQADLAEFQVDLMVFRVTETYPLYGVMMGTTEGTWHWPER
jgi:hypothetical protein